MTYNLNNLNVSSLDFDDIVTSLATFLNEQPDLADIDFQTPGSAANMLINILATATAYNGVYGQMSFINSWPSSATMTESVLSAASLSSIVIPYTKSANASATIAVSGASGMAAYSAFDAINTDGSSSLFYNIEDIPSSVGYGTVLYAGRGAVTYTTYDYVSQSMFIPSSVDPDTISLYVTATSAGSVSEKWTRVDKGNINSTTSNKIFTVVNATNGYLVTNNLPTSESITTSYRVSVKAVQSNGAQSNAASISSNSIGTITYYETPAGGYDKLNLSQAKAKFNFNSNSQQRCVTLNDFKNAIAASGLPYTDNSNNITVSNSSTPASIKVYVAGMSEGDQTSLLNYLSSKTIAGISVVYSL